MFDGHGGRIGHGGTSRGRFASGGQLVVCRRGLHGGDEHRCVGLIGRSRLPARRFNDRRPGERRSAHGASAVAAGSEVVLGDRPVGHRSGVVKGIRAHRAPGGQKARHNRGRGKAPCHGIRPQEALDPGIHAPPAHSSRVPAGRHPRAAPGLRHACRETASPGDFPTTRRRPKALPPAYDSHERLFPPKTRPFNRTVTTGILSRTVRVGSLAQKIPAKPPEQPVAAVAQAPEAFGGRLTPIRSISRCMSSQTSRLADGFRSR